MPPRRYAATVQDLIPFASCESTSAIPTMSLEAALVDTTHLDMLLLNGYGQASHVLGDVRRAAGRFGDVSTHLVRRGGLFFYGARDRMLNIIDLVV